MPSIVTKITRQDTLSNWILPYDDESVNQHFIKKEIDNLHHPAMEELKNLSGYQGMTVAHVDDTLAEIRYNFDTITNVRNAYNFIASPPENSATFRKNQRIQNLLRAKKLVYYKITVTEHW